MSRSITIAKGYSRVIKHLALALPVRTIKLGRKVKRIELSTDDGGRLKTVKVVLEEVLEIETDHMVVTVLLGSLKAKGGM